MYRLARCPPKLEQIQAERIGGCAMGFVEAPGRSVAGFSADPSLLAAQRLAERKHLVEHLAGNPLPLQRGRPPDLVDIEFGRLVRMPVNDRGNLGDHLAGAQRHEQVVAGLCQVGGGAPRVDRLVKNSFRNPIEDGLLAGSDLSDLKLHPRRLRACLSLRLRWPRHRAAVSPRRRRGADVLRLATTASYAACSLAATDIRPGRFP